MGDVVAVDNTSVPGDLMSLFENTGLLQDLGNRDIFLDALRKISTPYQVDVNEVLVDIQAQSLEDLREAVIAVVSRSRTPQGSKLAEQFGVPYVPIELVQQIYTREYTQYSEQKIEDWLFNGSPGPNGFPTSQLGARNAGKFAPKETAWANK